MLPSVYGALYYLLIAELPLKPHIASHREYSLLNYILDA